MVALRFTTSTLLIALALAASACGSKGGDDEVDSGEEGLDQGLTTLTEGESASSEASTTLDEGSTTLDESGTATDEGGDCGSTVPPADAELTGTVYAPNLEIPISGALVYLTTDAVEPVPDGVYCDECVQLDCDTRFVLTAADGSFALPAVSGAGQQLVIQKGQFLRVVDFDVQAGANVVPTTSSNLPGQWNPGAGMWIPRIAVYDTDPDKVKNVLAKFGLGQVDASGNVVPGSEQFTLINDGDQGAFMDDLNNLNQYHIVFLPCAATKTWSGAPNVPASRIANIQAYVDAGGKWYATDHSNEYIEAPFPSYQEFHNPGMPDIQPAYSSNGTIVDPELLSWLQALPAPLKDIGGGNPTLNNLPSVTTTLSYSGIDSAPPVIVQNDMGEDVDVGHHTWIEGPCASCSDSTAIRPMAMTGQYGCGRMMYSTFETSSVAHQGLNPQELVLLYMILEIGVCFNETPPPPPID